MDFLLQIEHIVIIAGVSIASIIVPVGGVVIASHRRAVTDRLWRQGIEHRLERGEARFSRHERSDDKITARLDELSASLSDIRERVIRIEAEVNR